MADRLGVLLQSEDSHFVESNLLPASDEPKPTNVIHLSTSGSCVLVK